MKSRNMRASLILRGMKLMHFAISVALFVACWVLFYYGVYRHGTHARANLINALAYGVILYLLNRTYNAYNIGYASVSDNTYAQTLSNVIAAVIMYVISMLMYLRVTNPAPLLGLCAVQLLWNLAWSALAGRTFGRLHVRRHTAVIYRNQEDLRRLEEIRFMGHMFHVEKYIEDPQDDYQALERELDGFEAIIVAGVNATLRNGIAKYCIEKGVAGYFAPHVGDIIMQGAQHIPTFSVPILSVRRADPTLEYLFLKRLFDIVVCGVAFVVLSPFFLGTAIAVKAYDHGPVFYRQVRLTRDGRRFEILKFRSMRTDAEKDGVARLASEHDDRITPVGRVIRSLRLDELPQLINIIKGDMTIVGPRPERPEIAAQYEREMPAFSLRLQVKAGLTGFAQVYGKYNSNPYDKLQMDLMYINKMNVVEDLRLMFATVRILFMRESTEGVEAGQATAIRKA